MLSGGVVAGRAGRGRCISGIEYFGDRPYYIEIKIRFGSPTVPAAVLYSGIELVFDLSENLISSLIPGARTYVRKGQFYANRHR
jgi:hypothetical protein